MQLHVVCCAEPAAGGSCCWLAVNTAHHCLPQLSRCWAIIAVGLQTARAGLAVGAGDSQPHGAVARRGVCSSALDLPFGVLGSVAQPELGLAAAGRPPAGRSLCPTAAGLPEGASTATGYATDAWQPSAQQNTADSWRPALPPLAAVALRPREPLSLVLAGLVAQIRPALRFYAADSICPPFNKHPKTTKPSTGCMHQNGEASNNC